MLKKELEKFIKSTLNKNVKHKYQRTLKVIKKEITNYKKFDLLSY